MEITTSSFFSEQGSYFSISHKVDLLIRRRLNELIGHKLISKNKKKDKYINLIVATDKNTRNVSVKGPDANNNQGFVNWGMWLPYYQIIDNTNQIECYLRYYFDGAVQVFRYYDITEDDIREVQRVVEKEVIGNPEYDYEEETIELDLTDLDL